MAALVFEGGQGRRATAIEMRQRFGPDPRERPLTLTRLLSKHLPSERWHNLRMLIRWCLNDLPEGARFGMETLEEFLGYLRRFLDGFDLQDCTLDEASRLHEIVRPSPHLAHDRQASWPQCFMESLERSAPAAYLVILSQRRSLVAEVTDGQWPGVTPGSPQERSLLDLLLLVWWACEPTHPREGVYDIYNQSRQAVPRM